MEWTGEGLELSGQVVGVSMLEWRPWGWRELEVNGMVAVKLWKL